MEQLWCGGKVVSIKKGFGFVAPSTPLPDGFLNKNIFFAFAVQRGPRINEGDEVLVSLDPDSKARPAAKSIQPAGWSGPSRSSSKTRQRGQSASRVPNSHSPPVSSQMCTRASSLQRKDTKQEKNKPSINSKPNRSNQNEPFKSVSKVDKGKNKDYILEKEKARRLCGDYKSRFIGRVKTLNNDKRFGFVRPLEDLPEGYPEGKDVFFKTYHVETGGMELRENDIIDFSLGTKDKEKPMAMSAKVSHFRNRTSQDVEQFLKSLKTKCFEENDGSFYTFLSCDAVWECMGETRDMEKSTALLVIQILLEIENASQSMPHRYIQIMKVFCHTYFLHPWTGTLKKIIEEEQKLRYVDKLKNVKEFLLHVLRCVPEKLSAILTLLRPLVSTDTSSMDHYLFRVLRESARNSGCSVDDTPWENLPLVPSGKELLMEGLGSLQPVRKKGSYDSVEHYMDVYFRLFREDCFSALKSGVKELLNGKLDLRDMNVYHSVKLVGIHLTREDSGLAIALQVVPLRPVKNWATSSNLMFGNLLCLSVSGSFQDPIWATVVSRDVKLLESKNIIIVELCTESNNISDSDAIIQLSHSSGKITLVESPTYYRAYKPVLKALQGMDPESFPFKEQLVEADRKLQQPSYIQVSTTANMKILHETTGRNGEQLFESMGKNPSDSMLDISQYQALCRALLNKVAVIQGPPGTGKTFIGIKLVELILSMSTAPQSPIIVLTYKNHALDEFIKDLMEKFPNEVARVGGRCKEPTLEQCNLSSLRKEKKSPSLNNLMHEKYRQADEMKPLVSHAARELDYACQFKQETLLQHESKEQVVSLLVGCNWTWSKLTVSQGAKQVPLTIKDVRRYLERAMTLHGDVCTFMLNRTPSDQQRALQGTLQTLLNEAIQLWYPSEAVVNQVEIALGTHSDLDLNSVSVFTTDEAIEEWQLQDKKDIEDMENERLAAASAKDLRNSDIIEFNSGKKKSIPQLFSTSKRVVSQLPVAKLVNTENLWNLSEADRVKYVQCLLLKQFDEPRQQFEETLAKYQQISMGRNELEVQHDIEVLKTKKVVGMTITGASIHRVLLAGLQPSIVLVEEAAEVLEPQLIAALGESVQHLILIGDHKQLRPPVESFNLVKHFHFDLSMMERLINNGLPFSTLLQQNRMRPEFSKLLLDIYPDLKDNRQRVLKNQAPKCMEKSMFFWDHSNPEKGGRSYWNVEEAERATRLCLFFLQQGYSPKQVTILGAYQGQTALIRKQMRDAEKQYPDLFPLEPDNVEDKEIKQQRVEVHTIDLYQGDENDIVIVSLVRSNQNNKVGFLKLLNRRCVAQSRSRCGLYFIGNIDTVCSVGHWKKLVENMTEEHCVGPRMTLVCPRHPYSTLKVTSAADISLSSFCKVICNEMKVCKVHRCTQYCQPTHSHEVCKVSVPFRYDKCNHIANKPCSKPVNQMICRETCGQIKMCTLHLCKEKCGDNHSHNYCYEQVEFTYTLCKHANTKHCSQREDEIRCEKEVKINHPTCEHLVTKKCFQSNDAAKCKEPCTKSLPCGHMCNSKCGRPCTDVNNCKSCIKIKEAEEKRRLEAEKKEINEYKDKLKKELEKIKKEPLADIIKGAISPDGDDAAEYYQVEDRVKKYIQLKHKWFPEVKKIEKVTNPKQYKAYLEGAEKLQNPMNEIQLFHGTTQAATDGILKTGFRIPKTAGMFGKGIYFATDSSKSAQEIYTKGSNILLLCQVRLGKCKTVEKDQGNMDGKMIKYLGYDSLYAKRNTRDQGGVLFDEYVVYHPSQAFVKYIIHYECCSIPQEQIEKFAFFGSETQFSKYVLKAQRGRQMQDNQHDTHFRIAESQFLRLCQERGLQKTLTEVHYYVNPLLVTKFKSKADIFKSKYKQGEATEYIPAWHGTKVENIDKIVKENFRLDKLASNTGDRGWYGAGIYFSEFPDVSLGYGQQILLCMVLPGRAYDATHADRSRLQGKPCQAGYDSHRVAADKKGRGEELVIFDPDQILPCYVINYQ